MINPRRSSWLAGGGALLLVLALSGVVAAGATMLTDGAAPAVEPGDPEPPDTTLTFEDLDGDGIDDDCDAAVVPDPAAAAAAEAAVDADADGVVAVSEAARSNRIGGRNCNHGGYVSSVARDRDAPEPDGDACEVESDDIPDEPAAEGRTVSDVARSDAVGGRNCNHGGAVSEAARQDRAAKEAAREARRATKEAAREAKRATKEAARDARTTGADRKPARDARKTGQDRKPARGG